jgi:hypothetical protein
MTNPKKPKKEPSFLNFSDNDVEEFNRKERESARKRYQELKQQAEQIKDLRIRHGFWSVRQKEYKMNIWELELPIHASGVVSMNYGGMKLWLDFLIQCELDDLSNQIQHLPKDSAPIEPPLIDVLKVVHLYELGVIEFLEKRLNTASSISLGHVVARITGGNSDTAGRYISRIKDGEKIDDNNFLVARDWILSRYGKMKPLPEIKFDKDLE